MHTHMEHRAPRVDRGSNRRDLLFFAGAATALGAAVATGAVALASDAIAAPIVVATPFVVAEAKYRAAHARFNALPADHEETDPEAHEIELDALCDACDAIDNAPVADLREFAMAFLATHDDGYSQPNPPTIRKLVADAKRLTGAA